MRNFELRAAILHGGSKTLYRRYAERTCLVRQPYVDLLSDIGDKILYFDFVRFDSDIRNPSFRHAIQSDRFDLASLPRGQVRYTRFEESLHIEVVFQEVGGSYVILATGLSSWKLRSDITYIGL